MKIKIKNILLVLLCLGLIGCTVASKRKKLEGQVMQLKGAILEKDKEIKGLKDLLNGREGELKEKDAKIQELSRRLEMFGVFEK